MSVLLSLPILFCCPRIGFAIARRLAEDGAHVVISSRKQDKVDEAVKALKKDNLSVSGMVCHVTNPAHRKQLIEKVTY